MAIVGHRSNAAKLCVLCLTRLVVSDLCTCDSQNGLTSLQMGSQQFTPVKKKAVTMFQEPEDAPDTPIPAVRDDSVSTARHRHTHTSVTQMRKLLLKCKVHIF